ncbi:MAG TPA: GAF domain-containing protein, partial [Gemmatimonadales bacterium]|nr:GAF domain-containing protein [Gemmatimonadales bacterium]
MTEAPPDSTRRIIVQPAGLPVSGGPAPEISIAGANGHRDTSEARKLGTLLDVSQALAGQLNLQGGLSGLLVILGRRCAAVRGAVALLDERTGDLHVRAGLSLAGDGQSIRYHVGEGITGQVAASGESIVVPEISQDPRFLHRAASRRERRGGELSFVCVPILLHRRPVGTLSIEIPHRPERDFERLLKFLRVVASMISQAVRIHRLLETERQRLVSENAQLRQELLQRYDFSDMVGASGPMRQLYEEMARVAGTNTTVLIRGESGTGK